jgi:hypothetical protein
MKQTAEFWHEEIDMDGQGVLTPFHRQDIIRA